MNRFPVEPGCVVRSLAGRDEGRLFLVIRELDEDFVLVADGGLRGMDRPKKKRRKHLKPTGTADESIRTKLLQGMEVTDLELRERIKEEG